MQVGVLILGLAGCASVGETSLADTDVSPRSISVDTTMGVVTLTSGTAATAQQSNNPAEIARGVPPVRGLAVGLGLTRPF